MVNIVLLDSPLGVGFSTTETPVSNMETVVQNFKTFLAKFLVLYPDFSTYNIYLGGVSYGGKFVPNVAYSLMNDETYNERFVGIFVMDGLIDTITQRMRI